jgi:hypothetical protein
MVNQKEGKGGHQVTEIELLTWSSTAQVSERSPAIEEAATTTRHTHGLIEQTLTGAAAWGRWIYYGSVGMPPH